MSDSLRLVGIRGATTCTANTKHGDAGFQITLVGHRQIQSHRTVRLLFTRHSGLFSAYSRPLLNRLSRIVIPKSAFRHKIWGKNAKISGILPKPPYFAGQAKCHTTQEDHPRRFAHRRSRYVHVWRPLLGHPDPRFDRGYPELNQGLNRGHPQKRVRVPFLTNSL